MTITKHWCKFHETSNLHFTGIGGRSTSALYFPVLPAEETAVPSSKWVYASYSFGIDQNSSTHMKLAWNISWHPQTLHVSIHTQFGRTWNVQIYFFYFMWGCWTYQNHSSGQLPPCASSRHRATYALIRSRTLKSSNCPFSSVLVSAKSS